MLTTIGQTIGKQILDKDSENHQNIKLIVEIGEGKYEEILTYNEISYMIDEKEDTNEEQKYWLFIDILNHQGSRITHTKSS